MELVEETGLGHGPILRALKWLTACRVVYPCGWDRDIAGKPVQTYRFWIARGALKTSSSDEERDQPPIP